MLVLTRKLDEKIQIGADITITIVRIKGQAVQIGIDAPRPVEVLRGELAAAADLRAEAGASLERPLAPATDEKAPAEPQPQRQVSRLAAQELGSRAPRSLGLPETLPLGGTGVLPLTSPTCLETLADNIFGFEVAFAW